MRCLALLKNMFYADFASFYKSVIVGGIAHCLSYHGPLRPGPLSVYPLIALMHKLTLYH